MSKAATSADRRETRGIWDHQCDFILSCLGYAVGLSNLWRFPILCFKHGGGTFLVAYSIMLAFAGLPLFFMEFTIGQYGGVGPNKLFGRIAPAINGLGYGMLGSLTLVCIYYNVILAWAVYYTVAGFTSQLPWQYCGNEHNTPTCYNKDMADECNRNATEDMSYYNNTCIRVSEICSAFELTHNPEAVDRQNFTVCNNGTHDVHLEKVYERRSPVEDYFERVILGYDEDTSWENFGRVRWEVALCLLFTWVFVGLCVMKGIRSSGKVVYFTALFPYFVLTVLLVRGATLEGAAEGVRFYVTPKFENLLGVEIWSDAASQIFYSLGASFGGLLALSSYNRFNNNCHRDAVLIALWNCCTSLYAGFVVFTVIGFMAHEKGQDVADVVAGGAGLAFVAYPEAVTKLPLSPLWSFLFFVMLLTLGLDSQFTCVETLITAVKDEWPQLRKKEFSLAIAATLIGFVLGLPMCANGGILMVTLIDKFCSSWSLLLTAITEVLFITYVYGHARLFDNLKEMGINMSKFSEYYWRLNWQFTTPLVLSFIILMTFVQFAPAEYNGYVFPAPYQVMGWLMACMIVVIVVGGGLYAYVKRRRTGLPTDWKAMTSPLPEWTANGSAGETATEVKATTKEDMAYTNEAVDKFADDTDSDTQQQARSQRKEG